MVQLNLHLILTLVNHVTCFVDMEFSRRNYWQLAFIHILTTAIHIWTVEVFLTNGGVHVMNLGTPCLSSYLKYVDV